MFVTIAFLFIHLLLFPTTGNRTSQTLLFNIFFEHWSPSFFAIPRIFSQQNDQQSWKRTGAHWDEKFTYTWGHIGLSDEKYPHYRTLYSLTLWSIIDGRLLALSILSPPSVFGLIERGWRYMCKHLKSLPLFNLLHRGSQDTGTRDENFISNCT